MVLLPVSETRGSRPTVRVFPREALSPFSDPHPDSWSCMLVADDGGREKVRNAPFFALDSLGICI